MNESLKRAWVYALRSGERKQIKGALANASGGFCALGVLGDIVAKREGYSGIRDPKLKASTEGLLPKKISELSGLCSKDPTVTVPLGFNLKGLSPGARTTISHLNDVAGASFEQIAGIIETQL